MHSGSTTLQLAPHLDLIFSGDDAVVLMPAAAATATDADAPGNRRLRGEASVMLCETLLDGPREARELAALVAHLDAGEDSLRRLQQLGALVPAGPALPLSIHWSAAGYSPARVRDRLQDQPVRVIGPRSVRLPLLSALERQGVLTREAGPAALSVVPIAGDPGLALPPSPPELSDTGQRWLPLLAAGHELYCGPVLGGSDGPCGQCLQTMLRANREVATALTPGARRVSRASARDKPVLQDPDALARVAAHVADWLVRGAEAPIHRALCRLPALPDANKGGMDKVLKRPHCSVCGSPRELPSGPPRLTSEQRRAPATDPVDGQLAFLQQTRHLVNPTTGVITRLRRQSDPDDWAHSYLAVHSASVGRQDPASLAHRLASKAAGKGDTDLAARVSATGEAIERFSCHWHGDEPVRRAALADLPEDEALTPESLLLLDHRQRTLAWRQQFPRLAPLVPLLTPLAADQPVDWSRIWSLTHERWRLLPQPLLLMFAPQPEPAFCHADSSGCAAGPDLASAAVNGLLELIERDAVAIWWYNRLRRPCAPVGGLSGWLQEMARRYRARDRELWLLDLTTDLGVPVAAAVTRAHDGPTSICLGFGAGLTPADAARSAVLELNQRLPFVEAWRNGDRHLMPTPLEVEWWSEGSTTDHPHLVPDPQVQPPAAQCWHDPESAVVLQRLVRQLAAHGLEVLLADLTRPELQIPVARVLVPGLRPILPRFAPGRLFQVPVRTGEREMPMDESALNGTPPFW